MKKQIFFAAIAIFAASLAAASQNPTGAALPNPSNEFFPAAFSSNQPVSTPSSSGGQEYRIGKDDFVQIVVFDVPSLETSARVSASGTISMALVGELSAASKTPRELEQLVESTLRAKKLVNEPQVRVLVREYASQPVSMMGAVRVPGIYQIKGQKYLLEMLAMAQGLDQALAGQTIHVYRRESELGDAIQTSINVEDLFEKGKSELNIPIKAGDVINVLPAGSIFVVGEVTRPGEYVLRQGKNVTVTKALALGGGFNREAKKNQSLIIRLHSDGTREEIKINAQKILDGSLDDVALMENDILFIPSNKVKNGIMKALDQSIQVVTGRMIYRF
jgi:polysaccharide export outer membrane protein